MNKIMTLEGGMPLNILQIGHGSFGLHLAKHLNSHVQHLEVTTSRNLEEFDFKLFDYIFLATDDSSLKSLIDKFLKLDPDVKVVHFSGFHYFENALGLHPVSSFNKNSEYNFDEITFIADGFLNSDLESVFIKVKQINPVNKKDYHNFLSVTANSLQLIVHQIGNEFYRNLKLDPDLLKSIVLQSLKMEREKGERSFSGPWIRDEKEKQDEAVALMNAKSLQNLNILFKKEIENYKKEKRII